MIQAVTLDPEKLETLLTSNSVVAIDCFATWCGPCQVIHPFIDRLDREYEGRATVVQLDVDRHKELTQKLGVCSIPSVLILKDGQLVEKIVGIAPYETFCQALDRHL